MVQVFAEIATAPFAGEIVRSRIVGVLVEVEQAESTVVMSDRYCFTDVSDGTVILTTEIPNAFIAALPNASRTAQLTEFADAVPLVQNEYVEVRRSLLTNPNIEELPSHVDEPRVFEQDGDGHPGIKVRITVLGLVEGKTYVVQQVCYRFDGLLEPQDSRFPTARRQSRQLRWRT